VMSLFLAIADRLELHPEDDVALFRSVTSICISQ
jgi:hypothetical protein